MFKKTGVARVQAIVGKVSSIVDELQQGISEINKLRDQNDDTIRAYRAEIKAIGQENQALETTNRQAAALAVNLMGMIEEK